MTARRARLAAVAHPPSTCCRPTAASAAGRPRSVPSSSTPSSPGRLGDRDVAPPGAGQAARRRRAAGLTDLFGLPDGWEIVLGNGGTTVFWDVATFGLVDQRSEHLVFGEFSSKFAEAAPRRRTWTTRSSSAATRRPPDAGPDRTRRRVRPHPQRDVDRRGDGPAAAGRQRRRARRRRRHVRGRRPAVGPGEVDVYYFAPQKCFASDGGLWVAACSPGGRRAHRAHRRLRPLAPGLARPRHRPDQQPPRPDVQHAGGRHPAPVRRPAALDARVRAASTGASSAAGRRPTTSTAGPRSARGRRRSSPIRPSARRSSARSTSTTRSTPPRSARRCGPTASSTPTATASSAATSCASGCSRPSTRPTSRR